MPLLLVELLLEPVLVELDPLEELLLLVELEPVMDPVLDPVELELVVPPQGPQTPSALPGWRMQLVPGQQSALVVHLPQSGTQVPPW